MQLHLRDTFHEVYLLNIGVGFFWLGWLKIYQEYFEKALPWRLLLVAFPPSAPKFEESEG